MKLRSYLLGAFLALAAASPAMAERLTFDHRLVPQLKAMLDSGRSELIDYNASNPRYVVDRIVVRGTSLSDWSELLEIVARTPDRKTGNAQQWFEELQRREGCKVAPNIIASDQQSLTVERRPGDCATGSSTRVLFRVVAGRRSMFLLAIHTKHELSALERQEWLALLGSAQLD